jgi:hypothetical protein
MGGDGFTSILYNPTVTDQLRFAGGARLDYDQVPNDPSQTTSGYNDRQREQDFFASQAPGSTLLIPNGSPSCRPFIISIAPSTRADPTTFPRLPIIAPPTTKAAKPLCPGAEAKTFSAPASTPSLNRTTPSSLLTPTMAPATISPNVPSPPATWKRSSSKISSKPLPGSASLAVFAARISAARSPKTPPTRASARPFKSPNSNGCFAPRTLTSISRLRSTRSQAR